MLKYLKIKYRGVLIMLERRTLCPFKFRFPHKKVNIKSPKINHLRIVENVFMGIPLNEILQMDD